MTAPWRVDLEVASYSWTVTDLDPATPGPTAPLTLRRALPDDDLWPAQPLPMSLSFGLVTADATDLAGVVQGADCWLSFTAPPNPDPVVFAGTVSDVEVEPARFVPAPDAAPADGVRLTVTAIGYLAQLNEEPIAITETAGGSSTFYRDHLYDLFGGFLPGDNATPWQIPEVPPGWFVIEDTNWFTDNWGMVTSLDVQGEALGPHLDEFLRYWLWDHDNTGELVRLVVEPYLDPVTHHLGVDLGTPGDPYWTAWQFRAVSNRVVIPPTAQLADTPEGWGVVVAEGTIPAARVDRGVRFVQRKRSNVNQVVVPYVDADDNKEHTASASNGDKPNVSHTIPTRMRLGAGIGSSKVTDIAEFYLPSGGADKWGVDTVTWLMGQDTPGKLPPDLGELVVIGGVIESQNPNGRGWIVGLVRGWTLNLPDATVELELASVQGRATGDTSGARMTWDEVPAGVTWDQLRPDHTWDDYEHLEGA